MLESIRIRCRAFMVGRTGSSLPTVVCFTLVACILGVDIHTRRMCAADRPVVQASAGARASSAKENVETAKQPEDVSPSSQSGLEPGIEFRIGQGSAGTIPDGWCGIGATWMDMQLDIELIRRGSDTKTETSGGR